MLHDIEDFVFIPPFTFADNRGWGMDYPYRDDEEFLHSHHARPDAPAGSRFHELVKRSASLISDSYGWAPNRAAKIYYEAYEANERLAAAQAKGALTAHQASFLKDVADAIRADADLAIEGDISLSDWLEVTGDRLRMVTSCIRAHS